MSRPARFAALVLGLVFCLPGWAVEYSEQRVGSGVPGVLPVKPERSYEIPPKNLTYSATATTPLLVDKAGNTHLPWWNEVTKRLTVTVLDKAAKPKVVVLPGQTDRYLAVTLADSGYYYLTLTGVDETDLDLALVHADLAGKLLKRQRLDPSIDGFDLWRVDYTAALDVLGNRVALALSRFLNDHGDGLHHQTSLGAVFDATTLERKALLTQLSGHSMDLRLINDGQQFLTLSLGDNYPRGLVLHRFDDQNQTYGVVFTFKTALGTVPSPFRKGLEAGRWSNDNETYTEVGDVVPLKTLNAVLVARERSLNSADAKGIVNEARNLALVLVSPTLPVGNEVISKRLVLSKGEDSPEFGFYNFDGGFQRQKSTGVVWLSDYTDVSKGHASHPKLVGLPDGRLVTLWEEWRGDKYATTWLKVLDPSRPLGGEALDLGPTARLPVGTRPTVAANQVTWATAEAGGFVLHKVAFEPLAAGSTAPSLGPWLNEPVYADYRMATIPAGTTWTVNQSSDVAARLGTTWSKIPGDARQVAVDLTGRAWKLAAAKSGDSQLAFWNGQSWTATNASGVRLGFDGSGTPILQDAKGTLRQFFLKDTRDLDSGEGTLSPVAVPAFKGVARDWAFDASFNTVWRLGPTTFPGGFEVFASQGGGPWTSLATGANRVVVDGVGTPWLLTNKGQLLRGEPKVGLNQLDFQWVSVPGKVRDLFRGAGGALQALSADEADFHLLTWNGKAFVKL